VRRDRATTLAPAMLALLLCAIVFTCAAGLAAPGRAQAGATLKFGAEKRLGKTENNPSTPFLRYGPDGRLYAIWTEEDPDPAARTARVVSYEGTSTVRAALVAWSADGGKSWSEPRQVNDSVEKVQDGESGPRIAFGADNKVYVVWSITGETGILLQGNVRMAMEDGKGAFTPARTLNEVKGSARFPVVEVAPDGNLLVAWVDRRIDNPKPRQLYLMRLAPDGKALTKNYQVGEGMCECCRIGMAQGDGGRTVYVASRQVSPEKIRNHAVRKSTDGGASFGPPVEISDDGWKMPVCPDSGPTIVLDDRGHVHVTWFTLGRSPEKEGGVYYAVSKDSGRSFSPRQLVQGNPGALLHTTLAVGKNRTVYFAWDNLDSSSKSQIFMRALGPDGRSWGPMQQISRARKNATRPVLAVSEKDLHVAWTEAIGEASWVVLRSAPLIE
jgi:hypothetical protein